MPRTSHRSAAHSRSTTQPSWTPLHWLAVSTLRADLDVRIRFHVAEGEDPNAVSDQGDTPLHLAAWNGNAEALSTLLALGACPHRCNASGHLPLHQALRKKHWGLVMALTDAGSDVLRIASDGRSALAHWVDVGQGAIPSPRASPGERAWWQVLESLPATVWQMPYRTEVSLTPLWDQLPEVSLTPLWDQLPEVSPTPLWDQLPPATQARLRQVHLERAMGPATGPTRPRF